MNQYSYDLIWKLGISPVLEEVYESISKSTLKGFNVNRVPNEELKKNTFQTYCDDRNFMKNHFFNLGPDRNNLIDFHKICSCIIHSLAKNRFLEFDLRPGAIQNLMLYNYQAAFMSGVRCQWLLCVARLEKLGNRETAYKLWDKGRFEFPQTNRSTINAGYYGFEI